MMIEVKHLLGLGVETVSGTPLGKIRDIQIDAEAHAVRHYEVRSTNPFSQTLLVSPEQVVGITANAMTVEDNAVKEPDTAKVKPGVVPTT